MIFINWTHILVRNWYYGKYITGDTCLQNKNISSIWSQHVTYAIHGSCWLTWSDVFLQFIYITILCLWIWTPFSNVQKGMIFVKTPILHSFKPIFQYWCLEVVVCILQFRYFHMNVSIWWNYFRTWLEISGWWFAFWLISLFPIEDFSFWLVLRY